MGAVNRIADDGVFEAIERAHKTMENFPGMNTNPNLAGDVAASGAESRRGEDGLLNREGGADGFPRVLHVRLRAAEHREDGITHKFIHGAVVPEDRFDERLEIMIEHV